MLLNTIHLLRCGGSDIVMGIFTTSEKHGNQLFHQVCIKSSELQKKSEEKVQKKIATQQLYRLCNMTLLFKSLIFNNLHSRTNLTIFFFLPSTNTLLRLQPNHQAAKYHTDWKPVINTESKE